MPIIDIECVGPDAALPDAQPLADALGRALHSPPGRTWVRLHALAPSRYAENEMPDAARAGPVFVAVLLAELPEGEAREALVRSITSCVANQTGRTDERVHVEFKPAARGRQAFGGSLVR
ncbi:MAG TPA: hypothetical protein VFV17_02765 [Usitatibacteraceae bacterium]|nr:hypothetical protein [Usitatibacteraceae bacterium]